MTVRAIYENGVFKPSGPVDLPDKSEVELEATVVEPSPVGVNASPAEQSSVYEIFSRRYDSGQVDTAACHDEHQP